PHPEAFTGLAELDEAHQPFLARAVVPEQFRRLSTTGPIEGRVRAADVQHPPVLWSECGQDVFFHESGNSPRLDLADLRAPGILQYLQPFRIEQARQEE